VSRQRYSAASKCPSDDAISPSAPIMRVIDDLIVNGDRLEYH
jgi:hypothetical protein